MKYILTFLLTAALLSCNNTVETKTDSNSDMHQAVVQEVLHAKEYSYIRVLENGTEKWVAAPTTAVEIGGTYYYGKSMEMKNFESKDLNRAFETIYFIEKISTSEEDAKLPLAANPHPVSAVNTNATAPPTDKKEVVIEATEGTITIAELYANKEKYNNTVVQLKGKVTKFNPAIMNMNWLHIQDGTDFNGNFDITATTLGEVQLEDIVTIEGKVILDKDFGAGYLYAVLIEDATVTK